MKIPNGYVRREPPEWLHEWAARVAKAKIVALFESHDGRNWKIEWARAAPAAER